MIRITDRANGAGTVPATVQDFRYALTIPCNTTADATVGSTCSITTSADTLVPGTIKERERSIWQLGQVEVLDGGNDGVASTTPNTVFARQGLFVP